MIVIWGKKMAYLTMVVGRYGDSFSMKISLPKSPYGNVKMIILWYHWLNQGLYGG